MGLLDLVGLPELMKLTMGRPDIIVGIIDGPVAVDHADLTKHNIREIPGNASICAQVASVACLHGTFVAGILGAKRGATAPAICPNCTFLVRPIFREPVSGNAGMPEATAEHLASAILECIAAGARILNLSLAVTLSSSNGREALEQALDYAARRGVVVIAAAGNQGIIGGSAITGHPWVIPVAACDLRGIPLSGSNLGHSIGRHGLRAPGDNVTSLGAEGRPLTLRGTSVAAPFVTGAIALVSSEFPIATGAQLRWAFLQARGRGRGTVTPPLLDAWAAYQTLSAAYSRR
jgi:subtilisin family serine protease